MNELRNIATDYSQPWAVQEIDIAMFTEEYSSFIIPEKLHRNLSVKAERNLRNLLI